MFYRYGKKEITYLKKRDKKLGEVIDRVGFIEREVEPDIFKKLIDSMIAQQISKKAAATVWDRFCKLAGEVTPQNVAALEVEAIQACGMTVRKAGYIHSAATANINYRNLQLLSEKEIMTQLTALPGIGVWTVEMLLLHSLQKPNIFSWGDLAIRKGIEILYNKKEKLTKKEFDKYKKRYSPYGSVASLYLWYLSHGA